MSRLRNTLYTYQTDTRLVPVHTLWCPGYTTAPFTLRVSVTTWPNGVAVRYEITRVCRYALNDQRHTHTTILHTGTTNTSKP